MDRKICYDITNGFEANVLSHIISITTQMPPKNIVFTVIKYHYTLKYAYSYLRTERNIKVGRLAILLRIPHYQAERQLANLAEVFVSPK
jgi:hypothetical protein